MIAEHSLFQALAEGATCLTVNKRLARELLQRYEVWQTSQGVAVWETPDILPQTAWLSRTYEQQLVLDTFGAAALARLPDAAERLLWEQVIAQAEAQAPLLHVPQAAAAAQEAYALLHAWRLPEPELRKAATAETRAFLRWRKSFDEHCMRQQVLPAACLPERLDAALLAESCRALWLAGVDAMNPQWQALLERLRAVGVSVQFWEQAPAASTQAMRLALPDLDQELLIAARWARQRAQANPQARIAIVVPELAKLRARLLRTFDSVLDEASLLQGESAAGRLYNLSLGLPLVEAPLIDTALRILDFRCAPVAMQEFSALLRSPFLAGGVSEAAQRARFDAELRRHGHWQITLASLTGKPIDACPLLSTLLKRLLGAAFPERATPAVWRQVYTDILSAVGWPGERALDSPEYQTLAAWRDSLTQFARLGVTGFPLDRAQALRQLRRLLTETLFQPESAPANIQVLGLLEAAGGQFDHLWLLGLHDGIWPAEARPNPLLPPALQRHHGLPHASPAHELEYAQRLTVSLLSAAGEVVVSHPQHEEDRELRPSPLILALPEIREDALALSPHAAYAWRMHAVAEREKIIDEHGVALTAGTEVRGGERLFADTAACPFRGYAAHRLGARPLDDPEAGLDSAQRGSLVHRALASLWGELDSQQRLLAEDAARLTQRIRRAATTAMQPLTSAIPPFGRRVLALEQARLETLLAEWLEQEKQRAPFEVLACEETMETEIDGLKLTLRADRIDRLQNGGLALIDYKTTAAKPRLGDWDHERLQSPQLPLYGMSVSQAPAALVYAWLRPGESRYVGDGEDTGEIQGVPPAKKRKTEPPDVDWPARLARWRSSIESLAQEIRSGEARVTPFARDTCNYCPLPGLCRVESPDFEEDEDADDESA